jgi:hypothetical protein
MTTEVLPNADGLALAKFRGTVAFLQLIDEIDRAQVEKNISPNGPTKDVYEIDAKGRGTVRITVETIPESVIA